MSNITSSIELRTLKQILRDSGVRQEDLAKEIGISQEQLSRILNGKTDSRSEVAQILMKKYAHKLEPEIIKTQCQSKITEAALALWDGTPSSAEKIISFLISARNICGIK
ncbi:helix-turn-helix transcriptional regulator [Undibacterium sp. CY7W]|uniref:Helix-turn-helix transcriptional regulator n=1 Tax=Undibacterium rugosum TaxID=2762291 RepID=A0A923I3B7_9BURK|nr:helix-turn-helix transcriptional regulator [Undibacterium rugosum]MBC3936998.1 helix-turn-helix transcriptional regulator [Undibacterium rugosum]